MDERILYHVITERPIQAGQTLLLDGSHPNGVCRRVEACRKLFGGARVDPDLEAFIMADPDRWKAVMYREIAMEKVRAAQFPQYPSRMACLYTAPTPKEAWDWAAYFGRLGRTVFGVGKILVKGRVFTGDAAACFEGTGEEEDLIKARRYWTGDYENPNPVWETLADGAITFLELLEKP